MPAALSPVPSESGSRAADREVASQTPTSPSHHVPERPRHYHTTLDDPEREGEEAEREFADFGGDVPTDRVLIRRTTRRAGRQRSNTGSSFPSLHLVDSAYSASHREVSRVYSRAISATGEVVTIKEPPVDPNKVDWSEEDEGNPQNWTVAKKWGITALCSLLTVNVTFASSAPSSTALAVAKDFGVSVEVSILATTLYLVGYAIGPILWAPLSELYGRKIIFVITTLAYTIFQLPSALAPNIQSLLIGRLLAGTFAVAPLTNCGGVIADIWDPVGRGPAMSIFTAAVFMGPVMGPIIGGFVTSSYLTWRWVYWAMMIFGAACLIPTIFLLPETYAPILLAKRARALRKAEPEANKELYAELERADFSLKSIIVRTIGRPFKMLAVEPILIAVTFYLSIVYGLLYALFSVFPIVFGDLRGFNNGEVGLMFIGVGVGTSLGAVVNIAGQRHYKTLVPKWHGHPPPEERLFGAMIAGPFLVTGIFMLGWTGMYSNIHWIVPEIAAVFLGMSFTLVFISLLSYLVETYLFFAASALASCTIIRSGVASVFPLFTNQMFAKLGVGWACSLIGLIGLIISPAPFIFYRYGADIRGGSQFAPCLDIHMRDRVEQEEREAKELEEKTHGLDA